VIVYLVLMDRNKRIDLTSSGRFTLSAQTLAVLDGLKGPVEVYAFYPRSMEQNASVLSDLLDRYHYRYKDFDYEVIDPDRNPGQVKEFGVEQYGDVYMQYGGKREKVKTPTEEGVTNAIIKLSQTQMKKIYFIGGHGEKSIEDYGEGGLDRIAKAIEAEHYKVEQIILARQKDVPEDAALLISAGPESDYDKYEIGVLERYLDRGGRVFFLLDPENPGQKLTAISRLLKQYGIILGNDIIIDRFSQAFGGDYLMPIVSSYTYNPITKDFRFMTFLRLARSVDVSNDTKTGAMARVIANTSDQSWAEKNVALLLSQNRAEFNEGVDQKGPVPVMAYSVKTIGEEPEKSDDSEKPPQEAIVLAAGDSDFITNSMYQTQGNKDLFLNSVNYLADRGELITVRPKQQESVYVTMTAKQGRIAFFVTVLLIPLFVIAVGIFITVQRRVRT
jgi:ABC-type uncharacterized transport system involved in gliding motility auxiliary subunit